MNKESLLTDKIFWICRISQYWY